MRVWAFDMPSQGQRRSEKCLARTNAIKQELWVHHSHVNTGGHTRVYSYTQFQNVFDGMEDGGIEHIRLKPRQTYKIVYQGPGVPPPVHYGFTTRTLWDGSQALFMQNTDSDISYTLLLDGSTDSEDGEYELTVWCNHLLRREMGRVVVCKHNGRYIYSIGPFGKSVGMFTYDYIHSLKGFLVVDIQGNGSGVTERIVRVDFGVDWKPVCMDFDDARGILTYVTWQGLIFHIHLV
jgi:hypothetical protein